MASIIKEGSLSKEGANWHSWKQRWFVLTSDGVLKYFKSPKDTEPLGKMNLLNASASVAQKKTTFGSPLKHLFAVTAPESSSGGKKFTNRTYYIVGKSDAESDQWIKAINSVSADISKSKGTTILVCGATGNVGSHVVDYLRHKSGVNIRAATRNPQKLKNLNGPNVEVVEFDLSKKETVEKALKGVQKVFFVNLTVQEGKDLLEHIKQAKTVSHIVKLSAIGIAEPGFVLGSWHVEIENLIKESGIPYTFLRPNTFHQNIGNLFGASVKKGDNIYSAWGEGSKVAYIDTRDIGAVAAEVLTRDGFLNKAIELSGSELLTPSDIAERVSKVAGRKVDYVNLSDDQFRAAAKGFGLTEQFAEALLGLYEQYKAGRAGGSSAELEKILGRKPITMAQYLSDYAYLFRPDIILVTGSTGNIGLPLLGFLSKKGVHVRAATRDPTAAKQKINLPEVEFVEFDYGKKETIDKALEGVTKVFFLTGFGPNMSAEGAQLVEHIKKSKTVKLIVKLSAFGIEQGGFAEGLDHLTVEKLIRETGIPFVFLRANSFHQNMGNFFGSAIKNGGNIYSAFGDTSKISYVDTRDVAAVAAELLTRDEFVGKTLNISGPEAIDHHQIAATISKVIARKVEYVNITDEQYRAAMKGYGFPDKIIDILLNLYEEYKAGRAVDPSKDLESVLGRPGITFEQYVRDNIATFAPESPIVLVTGATGNVGSPLVEYLSKKKGITVRAATRDPSKASHLKDLGVEVVEFDLSKPETCDRALEGVQKVFFNVAFSPNADKEARALVDAIKRSKSVKHIVKLSVVGADQPDYSLGTAHVTIENLIKETGISATFVRANSFFQNMGNFFGQAIKGGQNIYSAFGDAAKLAYIDTRDVAAVIAETLTNDEYVGKTVDISGPENLDHHQIAATITKVIGRKVDYVNIPDDAYTNAMKGYGFPESMIHEMLSLYREYQSGRHQGTPDTTEKIIGRKAITFEEYVRDNFYVFSAEPTVILVCGATGNIGKELVQRLVIKSGVAVKAATRDPKRAEDLRYIGAEPVEFDYSKPETIDAALVGVQKVFFLQNASPNMMQEALQLVEHLKKAKSVRHVVKISGAGGQHEGFILGHIHNTIENAIKQLQGVRWTFLKPNSFSQNMASFFGQAIQNGQDIYSAFGDESKLSYVDVRDIAEVAAEVLTREEFFEKDIEIHGPEQLDHHQIAAIISKVIGRTVRYVNITDEAYRNTMKSYGMPDGMIDALLNLSEQYKLGRALGSPEEAEKIIGRKLLTLEQTIRDSAHKFVQKPKVKVLVTGANGTLGSRISKSLLLQHKDQVEVRVAVRSQEKGEPFQKLGAQVAVIDTKDAASLDKALDGIDRILILPPFSEEMLPVNNAWVDAAKRANVSFVLKLGAMGSDKRATIMAEWHDDGEKYLAASKLKFATIRPTFVMTNLATQIPSIKKTGQFYQRFGSAKVNVLDPRDNGAVAAEILSAFDIEPFVGKDVSVLGTELITCQEIALIFSKILKRSVKYIDMTETQALEGMLASGVPEVMARGLVQLASLFRVGFGEQRNSTLEDILHRKGYSFEQFLRHHVDTKEVQDLSF